MNFAKCLALQTVSAAMISAFMLSGVALAQVPASERSTASPGRVEEQIKAPDVVPLLEPKIEVKEIHMQKMPANAEEMQFTLGALILEGTTVYKNGELSKIYASKIGQKISLADLYAIAEEITRKYRNDGYVLTQVVVPPQTIESGTARLKIVEGYIDNISVEGGDEKSALPLIKKYASRIKMNGNAMNVKSLERWLLLINDLPGISARSIISPSETKTGAADLRIIVERDPWDAVVGIDNHGSRYLGPVQVNGGVGINSLFGAGERISGQVVFAPDADLDRELSYVALSFKMPVFSQGTTVELSGSYTDTDPGFDLSPFDVEGESRGASIKIAHPFARSRNWNLWAHLMLDVKNIENDNNIPDPREDDIAAVRAGTRIEFLDQFFGVAVNALDLVVAKGVDFLGASDEGDARLTRPAADPQFFKANLEYQRLQRLTSDFNLLFAVQGQWSDDTLLSSEEFGVGGINYGRAYDASEIIGEEGIAGKFEIQWKEPYKLGLFEDYQLFGFYDAGRIWNADSAANNLKRDTITSAGFGLRGDITDRATTGLTIAFPLNRDVQTQRDRDPRIYFNLSQRF